MIAHTPTDSPTRITAQLTPQLLVLMTKGMRPAEKAHYLRVCTSHPRPTTFELSGSCDVPSPSGATYTVDAEGHCTCTAGLHGRPCWHLDAARLAWADRREREAQEAEKAAARRIDHDRDLLEEMYDWPSYDWEVS